MDSCIGKCVLNINTNASALKGTCFACTAFMIYLHSWEIEWEILFFCLCMQTDAHFHLAAPDSGHLMALCRIADPFSSSLSSWPQLVKTLTYRAKKILEIAFCPLNRKRIRSERLVSSWARARGDLYNDSDTLTVYHSLALYTHKRYNWIHNGHKKWCVFALEVFCQ